MGLLVEDPHDKSPLCYVGGHRHYAGGDITLLVIEAEDSRGSRFKLPLMFISKGHGQLRSNSDPCHTYCKQQLEKNMKMNFDSSPKITDEKEKRKKLKGNNKVFCITRKREKPEVGDDLSVSVVNLQVF